MLLKKGKFFLEKKIEVKYHKLKINNFGQQAHNMIKVSTEKVFNMLCFNFNLAKQK